MSSTPLHCDVHAVDICQGISGSAADHASWHIVSDMQCDRHIGLGESFDQPVVEHCSSPCAAFFSRLTNQHQCAGPFHSMFGQVSSNRNQIRHMDVVTTGVHDSGQAAIGVFHLHGGCVVLSGVLSDWQCVEVGSQHQHGAVAVLHDCHDSMTTDIPSHPISGRLPFVGDSRCRFFFLKRKFGMSMQVNVQVT